MRATDLAINLMWERALKDPVIWFKYFVKTLDEHDKENPVKPFPFVPAEEWIVSRWNSLGDGEHMGIAKSRQLRISWLSMGIVLWEAIRTPSRLIGVISKKEDDASKLIGETRMGVIYQNLPASIRSRYPMESSSQQVRVRHSAMPPSVIMAMPQGAHQARMHTFSMLFFDEAAFQDQLGEALSGALPTLHGGGKLLMVSSAAPGTYEEIWNGGWGE